MRLRSLGVEWHLQILIVGTSNSIIYIVALILVSKRDFFPKTHKQFNKLFGQYKTLEQKTAVFYCFTFNSSKEYENVREQHEEVKRNRNQIKEELKCLKEMQTPLTRRIQETEENLRNVDMRTRDIVGIEVLV